MFTGSIIWKGIVYGILMVFAKAAVCIVLYLDYFARKWWRTKMVGGDRRSDEIHSWFGVPHTQALLVASAMIARGEIGFLIASLSLSSGTLALSHVNIAAEELPQEDVFLVIVWAVVLCTIVGPAAVGIIVREGRPM